MSAQKKKEKEIEIAPFIECSLLLFVRPQQDRVKIVCVVGDSQFHNVQRDCTTKSLFGMNTTAISRLLDQTEVEEFYVEKTLFLLKSFSAKERSRFQTFTLALVFPNGHDIGYTGTKRAYQKFLMLLMKAYRREERRRNYVSLEVDKMYDLYDDMDVEASTWSEVLNSAKDQTRLANELDRILYDLRLGRRLQILINGVVILGFLFPKDKEIKGTKDLRIHKSVIITKKTRHLFPPDGLKDIKLLENWISPRHSIQDVAKEHILSISLIAEMVKHLLDWAVLKLIPKLTDWSILVSSAGGKTTNISLQEMSFFKSSFKFPGLIQTLNKMKEPKTYRDHYLDTFRSVGMEKKEFEKGIIWLIENEYVKQIEKYVQFFVPDSPLPDESLSEEEKLERRLTEAEKKYVVANCTEAEKAEMRMLDNIVGFCNGKYSVQEIMSIKGIKRKYMVRLLSVFSDVLFVYQI